MTIMGDVMVQDIEHLPSDVKIFLNKIASDDEWRQKYRQGSYNHIKFASNAGDVVESIPVKNLINMTMRTIKSSPKYALAAVRDVTGFVWELSGKIDMVSAVSSTSEMNVIQKILYIGFRFYDKMVLSFLPLAYLWTKIGWNMLLLLLFGLMAFAKNGKTALFLVAPSVAYNLGTMLLLSGYDIRFFHFNVVITVPLILVLLSKKENEYSN
ncbi:hypothetical protein FACS1894110_19610 [Spirochaetia bacterium]|nr:hypothetical protein FACS1894110_19610 [Spirochaetia bacterium]